MMTSRPHHPAVAAARRNRQARRLATLNLWKDGRTTGEIARALGCTRQAVHHNLKAWGVLKHITALDQKRVRDRKLAGMIVAMFRKGASMAEIRDRFHVSGERVRRAVIAAGLDPKRNAKSRRRVKNTLYPPELRKKIRDRRAQSKLPYKVLAHEFGLPVVTIGRICRECPNPKGS